MSHHAHGTQRSHGGATRIGEMESRPESPRVSLYQMLHPEMYINAGRKTLRNRRLTDEERKVAIIEDLRANGPATATQIARRLGVNVKFVSPLLIAGIDGVAVVRTPKKAGRSANRNVWGVKNVP